MPVICAYFESSVAWVFIHLHNARVCFLCVRIKSETDMACTCMQETLATEEISVPDIAARTEFAENGNAWLFTYELERERQDFCYNILAKKWAGVLGGFDIYTRTHCTVAITSLRID